MTLYLQTKEPIDEYLDRELNNYSFQVGVWRSDARWKANVGVYQKGSFAGDDVYQTAIMYAAKQGKQQRTEQRNSETVAKEPKVKKQKEKNKLALTGTKKQKRGGGGTKVVDDITHVNLAKHLDLAFGWLHGPIENTRNNTDLDRVFHFIIKALNTRQDLSRMILNSIQAMWRNKILRKEYGDNSPQWIKKKGYNHLMFLTGQFFNSITARFIHAKAGTYVQKEPRYRPIKHI